MSDLQGKSRFIYLFQSGAKDCIVEDSALKEMLLLLKGNQKYCFFEHSTVFEGHDTNTMTRYWKPQKHTILKHPLWP